MTNEINALELTDEQLEMVAGGKTTNTLTNNFSTFLGQGLSLSADTTNSFSVSNEGKKGGAGGAAQQSGASISGIVLLANGGINA
jgi:hypothetical protein